MTPPGQPSWRLQVLQGTLWVCTATGVPVMAYILMTSSNGVAHPATLLATILTAAVVGVTFARQLPFAWRAGTLISVLYTGSVLSIFDFGFAPGSALLMLLVVVLCGLFFGKTWLWTGLLVTGGTLAIMGALQVTGSIVPKRPELLDFRTAQNVIRMTSVYLGLGGTLAVIVSYTVGHIERSLHETSNILAGLEAERRGRAEAETALHESEEMYRHLVENINDVIYATDEKGVLTYLSPAVEAQSGYTPSELIGRSVFDFVHEADRAPLFKQFEATLSGHLEPDEFRIVIKSGEVKWIRSSSQPIYQGDRVTGLRGVYIDITEKKELETQLRQTYKMEAIGTLAGGIAHEFNNILTAILGFTELTQHDVSRNSTAWANLQHVLMAGERAKELVQQILAFSRQSDPARDAVYLSQVIQDVQPLLRASLPATIELRLHLNEATGTILANRTQLHQVLMNLCSNAEYEMRTTGGIIEVDVDAFSAHDPSMISQLDLSPGPWLRLTVRDTGNGIDPDIVDRIFDPFFTTKGIGEGTGMGLALVHGIVASHGGRIIVESTPGQGTTFTLYFPRVDDTPSAICTQPVKTLSQRTGRILFVDDEDMLARLGQGTLQRLGYDVEAYTSSLQALEAFQADPQQFDLVITDQTMPAMTGATLVEKLRRLRPDIPIILCTGFSHLMSAEKAQVLGVDAFMMKPGGTQDWATLIQHVLDQRDQQAT